MLVVWCLPVKKHVKKSVYVVHTSLISVCTCTTVITTMFYVQGFKNTARPPIVRGSPLVGGSQGYCLLVTSRVMPLVTFSHQLRAPPTFSQGWSGSMGRGLIPIFFLKVLTWGYKAPGLWSPRGRHTGLSSCLLTSVEGFNTLCPLKGPPTPSQTCHSSSYKSYWAGWAQPEDKQPKEENKPEKVMTLEKIRENLTPH